MRLTAIALGAFMVSCTPTAPSYKVKHEKIMVSLISSDLSPPLVLPPITITAPRREQKEVKKERSQPRQPPCVNISTGDETEDVRARLDCLVKLIEQ